MISFLLHVTLCLAFLTSQVSVGVAAEAKKEKAPEFVLTTFDKKRISLSDFRGRPVVLKLIASWWPECQQEAPALEKIYQKVKGKGVLFLGIFVKDTENSAKQFVAQHRLSFPSGLDLDQQIARSYRVVGPPVKIFIGKDGRIAERVNGSLTEKDLYRNIEPLMPK
jgi:cytochrome c biogenesis protein CcmG, thiol:disulfide interchange protein DsbE